VTFYISDWPFCPHGKRGNFTNFRDELPGGLWMENLGPKPIKVYSHTERKRIMAERGLDLLEKFCPMPGTDKDPQGIPNPKGYMDPQTLENARMLLSRQGEPKRPFDAIEDGVICDLFSGQLTERDVIAVAEGDQRRQSRVGRRIDESIARR
jgi:hypothetical protein